MAQEMSFAQALNEARQIIVQQSNRIKTDLDRIKSIQETVAAQAGTIGEHERVIKQKSTELDVANELTKVTTSKLEETRLAKEQAEAVIDRQGQRLTQMQGSINAFEKQVVELQDKIGEMTRELDGLRGKLPTQEDADALSALATLLSAKKGGGPKAPAEENAAAA